VIEAVVFDLDGVIIDSEPVWEQVRRRLPGYAPATPVVIKNLLWSPRGRLGPRAR
jgi:phosphoglycolate phosphatase-like HAD superfamily hydrolase